MSIAKRGLYAGVVLTVGALTAGGSRAAQESLRHEAPIFDTAGVDACAEFITENSGRTLPARQIGTSCIRLTQYFERDSSTAPRHNGVDGDTSTVVTLPGSAEKFKTEVNYDRNHKNPSMYLLDGIAGLAGALATGFGLMVMGDRRRRTTEENRRRYQSRPPQR